MLAGPLSQALHIGGIQICGASIRPRSPTPELIRFANGALSLFPGRGWNGHDASAVRTFSGLGPSLDTNFEAPSTRAVKTDVTVISGTGSITDGRRPA